jgi:glycerophosphoryl diester phosphodiesterase
MKLGVWFRVKDFTEHDDFYKKLVDYEVDYIISDFPLKAMEVRDAHLSQ